MATASSQLSKREQSLCNGISPWLSPLAMVVTQDVALKGFFRRLHVIGREHLPLSGPVLMAPTHRARWDALMLPYAAGRRVSGRDCRFMVTLDEMKGLQGWFLHRLGCFPVNQLKPQTASLRFAVDLLEAGQQLVVFPEGRIMREPGPIRLMQGLSRLALLASAHGLDVPVLPIGIAYGRAVPRFGDSAALAFGRPLHVQGHGREAAKHFSEQLAAAMAAAERQALEVVGRSAAEGGFAAPVEFSNVCLDAVRRPIAALALSALALVTPSLAPLPVGAQQEPEKVLESTSSGLNLASVQAKVAQGDAAAAAGKLSQAKADYDQALEAATYLVSAYRNLSGAFRGLDARIPREMDQKGREATELQANIELRLAALLRRMNQPQVAVPLLVRVVQRMSPTSPQGQKAYQSLLELGFVATPYTAATAAPAAQ